MQLLPLRDHPARATGLLWQRLDVQGAALPPRPALQRARQTFTLDAQDWPISIFGLPARLRAHAALHPSLAAAHVVLLQSGRWDLHAWFMSKGMKLMREWELHPFVTQRMLREYEVDARAAFYEVAALLPLTKLWGLVLSPPGVMNRAKSGAPFLQATLNEDAHAAVKAVLKSVAQEFGFVLIDWGGMIERAGQLETCESAAAPSGKCQGTIRGRWLLC